MPGAQRRLNSWKAIAAYLEVSVRTVQRWEATEHLPVRRHWHARQSTVYADASELDRWWDSRPPGPGEADAGPTRRAGGQKHPSIVVLPFSNLDRDEETEFLADGLTEELISALSQSRRLRVVARSTSFHFKGSPRDVREIGARLGVDHVLEGSVRRAGTRLRIIAQLVSAADGCHRWTQQFTRELDDPFELPEQLAEAIATGLRVRLFGRTPTIRRAHDPEVDNALLRGRYFWNQRTADSIRKALHCFEEVVDRRPDLALGHAGMADCYGFLWAHRVAPWKAVIPQARAAVSRALALDRDLSDVHTTHGLVLIASFDLHGARRAFRRALERNPGDHRARHWGAMATGSLGRLGDAIAEIRMALDLDPFGVTVNHDLGLLLYASGRHDEARLRLRHTLEIAPTSYWARVYLTLACVELAEHQEALESAGVEPALRACVRARMGDPREATRLSQESPAGPSAAWRALLDVTLGQHQRAVTWLSRAVERHEPEFLNVRLALRGHPGFAGVRTVPGAGRFFPELST